MQLIVAEKPSVARDLARVLGVRRDGQHCFKGDARVITWCIGHLVELDEPAAYDPRWKAWRLDRLPMLPAEFRLRPARHAVAQLREVVALLRDRRFRCVVNACDAGREGELIFRYLVRFAGTSPPVQRLWISSLTDEAIRRGFAALRPGSQFDALGDAARSRSEADWLVGMNATRAITARGRECGHTALYSIGRVQTPTLAMLVQRERTIRAFVPRDYWEIRGEFVTTTGERFGAGWRYGDASRLATAELADAIVARDRQCASPPCADAGGTVAEAGRVSNPAVVERVRSRTVRESPPMLFDLTSLQRTANRRFGFSAARTLEIAQALYERHKLVTYPRTDSRHLTNDVVSELPALFAALAALPDYAAFAGELAARRVGVAPDRRVVDDAKVHDHHAIIPTGKLGIDRLDRDERRLFDLVVRRFLGVFYADAEFAITEAWIRVGAATAPEQGAQARDCDADPPILDTLPPEPDRYLARGRVRIAAGWQAVAGIDERSKDGDALAILPPLAEGQTLRATFASLGKRTTPPARFSEATLLGAMESAGKSIDDEALRAVMKDVGLGTPATRAAIIETLLKREYVVRSSRRPATESASRSGGSGSLVPTALGIGLIDALAVPTLASAELTGAWEARLARIARGEESRATFMADIARYVEQAIEAIRRSSPQIAPEPAPIGRCPRCGGTVVARPRGFACDGTCGFALPNRVAGLAIGNDLAAALLSRRRSHVVRGFRSKAGKRFAAALVLDDQGEIRFDFDRKPREQMAKPVRPKQPPALPAGELACPRCRDGAVIAGARGWGCSRWKAGCKFVVWFETAGRRLSAAQLRDLVTRGKTRKAKFATERGVEVSGRLVLEPTTDGGSTRFEPS